MLAASTGLWQLTQPTLLAAACSGVWLSGAGGAVI